MCIFRGLIKLYSRGYTMPRGKHPGYQRQYPTRSIASVPVILFGGNGMDGFAAVVNGGLAPRCSGSRKKRTRVKGLGWRKKRGTAGGSEEGHSPKRTQDPLFRVLCICHRIRGGSTSSTPHGQRDPGAEVPAGRVTWMMAIDGFNFDDCS